jgi:hypothetical protein
MVSDAWKGKHGLGLGVNELKWCKIFCHLITLFTIFTSGILPFFLLSLVLSRATISHSYYTASIGLLLVTWLVLPSLHHCFLFSLLFSSKDGGTRSLQHTW